MITIARRADASLKRSPQQNSPLCETQAAEALRDNSHSELTHVRCDMREGMAILHGEVPTYYLKQLAQEIVGKLEGVDLIVNRLVVTAPK